MAALKPDTAKDDAKQAKADAKAAATKRVVDAVRKLCDGWQASGFYDRQDPVYAVDLHDALEALDK